MSSREHFAWLMDEVRTIRTRRFHVVDGPASGELVKAIAASAVPFPPSYCDFVGLFGNARLYRQRAGYAVGVLASPRRIPLPNSEILFEFGHFNESPTYFKASLLSPGKESPVFEGPQLEEAADGFLSWLETRSRETRSRFGCHRWLQILKGPKPFNSAEQRIVEARRLVEWRVIGIDPGGSVCFEISNRSDMPIPYLTVGVRHKNGVFEGAVWLPISGVHPGRTEVVRRECYKRLASPTDLEFFSMPDPDPEDREDYWEFR